MTKKLMLFALMAVSTISVNAQLEVNQNGHVAIGATNPGFSPKLSVGDFGWPTMNMGINLGVGARPAEQSGTGNVGMMGYVISNSALASETNHGVIGATVANPNHGRNYGVSGMIDFNPSNYYGGTGVYATNHVYYYYFPSNIQGVYAAYFVGDTNIQGQMTAQGVYTPADNSLSENVEPVATRGGEGMLDNLLRMNVREFNLKSSQPAEAPENLEEMPDEVRQSYESLKKDQEQQFSRRHFGLSAQELKEIYPNLVLEAQDGYLYVNYTELVPVLIRAIQELKGELDAVKGSDNNARKAPAATSVNTAVAGANVLYQNTPNPFKEQTTIRFSLDEDAQSASICIFDMTGKMLKTLPISSGDSSVSIAGWELGEGMFLYSLIVNGKEIDTKRMIITK